MSYCSRSRRRRFTVFDFKSEHLVAFVAICQQHFLLRMRSNGYLGTSVVNLDTTVRFPDSDLLWSVKVQPFSDVFH